MITPTLVLLIFWTLASLVLTLNVLHPLIRRSTNSPVILILGFSLGWLVGDLAPQWVLLNFGIFLLFFSSGLVDPGLLWFFFLFHLFCWILLTLRLWLVLDLPGRLEQQLLVQLGSTYSDIQPSAAPPRTFAEADWKTWWFPGRIYRNPRIRVEFDRQYDAAPELKLDLYRPSDSGKGCPVLIQIHGGGWVLGTRRQAAPLLARMASRGWVCFSIDYRLSPEVLMPEHLIDCKRALHWIRSQASEFSIDPDAVFVTGGSAGAHLGLMMALTPNLPEFQPGFEEGQTAIQGFVGLYGVYDLHSAFGNQNSQKSRVRLLDTVLGGTPDSVPERYEMASPFHWPANSLPSCMLVQGGSDTLIPVSEV